MPKNIEISWLSEQIKNLNQQEIFLKISALINNGEIPPGSILPPLRKLAKELRVSPSTISGAWQVLRKFGMIEGEKRQGITVIGTPTVETPLRFVTLNEFDTPCALDLTFSAADPKLLPDLRKALQYAYSVPDLNNHQPSPIIPSLQDAVMSTWPYSAESFIATNTTLEALMFLLQTIVLPGTPVAVEDPSLIGTLDILKKLGAKIIPVYCDDEGPIPDKLAEALAQNPALFIYQPRVQMPSGYSVTEKRLLQMAELFKSCSTLIVEHDVVGDLSNCPHHSLGQYYPDRMVYIRGYSLAYGLDVGMAVLSSTRKIVNTIQNQRSLSVGWSSRLLQHALVFLLKDKKSQQQVIQARKTYTKRHNLLVDALNARGVRLPRGSGLLGLWLRVYSEESVLTRLEEQKIIAVPGSFLILMMILISEFLPAY